MPSTGRLSMNIRGTCVRNHGSPRPIRRYTALCLQRRRSGRDFSPALVRRHSAPSMSGSNRGARPGDPGPRARRGRRRELGNLGRMLMEEKFVTLKGFAVPGAVTDPPRCIRCKRHDRPTSAARRSGRSATTQLAACLWRQTKKKPSSKPIPGRALPAAGHGSCRSGSAVQPHQPGRGRRAGQSGPEICSGAGRSGSMAEEGYDRTGQHPG